MPISYRKCPLSLMQHFSRILPFGNELHRDGIYTVSRVLCCKPLSPENMAEVGLAIGADDFYSVSVGVGNPCYRAWNFIIETWPSASRVKLVGRTVEWCIAAPAHVC